jgi:hypothetical protein
MAKLKSGQVIDFEQIQDQHDEIRMNMNSYRQTLINKYHHRANIRKPFSSYIKLNKTVP